MPKPKPADAPAVTPDFLTKLKSLQANYDRARSRYEQAKERAKFEKESMDATAHELFDFIRGTDGAAPLFDGEEDDGDE